MQNLCMCHAACIVTIVTCLYKMIQNLPLICAANRTGGRRKQWMHGSLSGEAVGMGAMSWLLAGVQQSRQHPMSTTVSPVSLCKYPD
uniref:Uncharacterized protein n=1 Tax=Oryza nivara TaxID=4536 RepID=A0A0E0JC50_ORYNI